MAAEAVKTAATHIQTTAKKLVNRGRSARKIVEWKKAVGKWLDGTWNRHSTSQVLCNEAFRLITDKPQDQSHLLALALTIESCHTRLG